MDKISVIMGVYNPKDKQKLRESIDSILNQTYSNLEFIICNDNSNEEISTILEEYKNKDKRIILTRNNENLGLAASLNNALKLATGNFIARQDDDDISKENRLELELEFIKNNPEYSIVGCNTELFDENGVWGYRKLNEKPLKEDFLFGNQFDHPTILITKEALKKVNGYRVKKITRRTEDYDLFMRLYAEGFKGYNLQKYLYMYNESMYGYKKRKFKYRIDEVFLRIEDFKMLNLMPKGWFYIFKPIISGLVPKKLLRKINHIRYKQK